MAKKSPFQLRSGNSPLHQNTPPVSETKDTKARFGEIGKKVIKGATTGYSTSAKKEGKVKAFNLKGYFSGKQGLIPDYKGKTTAKTATNVSKNIQTQFKSVKKDVTTAAENVVKAGKSIYGLTTMGRITKKLQDSYTKYKHNKKKEASEGAAVGGMSGALTNLHKVKKNLKFKPTNKVTTMDSLPVKKIPVAENRPNIVRPPGYSS